jgi:type II secretory pathway pseudopilin PulG
VKSSFPSKRPRRIADSDRGWLDFERMAIVAILAVVALGTYSIDSNGAERAHSASSKSALRGSIATAQDETTLTPNTGKVAVVMTPLDLKRLSADAFDDDATDAMLTPLGTPQR